MGKRQPTYEDYKEEVTRAARAIIRPADELPAQAQEQSERWPVMELQNKLREEFEGRNFATLLNSRSAQVLGVLFVAVATWGFGVALYANL